MQRDGSTSPFLLFEPPNTSEPIQEISLTSGSVWCAASEFSNSCPNPSFIGLQITSGILSFPNPITLTTITTVPEDFQVKMKLQLVASTAGGLIDNSFTKTPLAASFTLSSSGNRLDSAESAALTAFGTTIELDFNIVQSSSKSAAFSDKAAINLAAWSIPVTIDPSTSLGAAVGAGGLSLNVGKGITVMAVGERSMIDCGPCTILVEPTTFTVGGLQATSQKSTQTFSLFKNSSLSVSNAAPFAFRYISEPNSAEVWGKSASFTSNLDQPRTINGDRLRLAGSAIALFFSTAATTSITVTGNNVKTRVQAQSFALKNLLLRTTAPKAVRIDATYANNALPQGSASLTFGLLSALPFLPDPYATSLDALPDPEVSAATSTLTMVIKWVPATPVTIDVVLSFPSTPSTDSLTLGFPSGVLTEKQDQSRSLTTLRGSATRDTTTSGLPRFLDLSTSVSQFGVILANLTNASFSIASMFLQAPNENVAVFALPAIQWEPVVTNPNRNNFPSPLTFPDCGDPFLVATKSVALVPVAPRQALDGIVGSYNSATPQGVVARFTLPFGIQAETELQPSETLLVTSPGLKQVQPTFAKSGLQSGDQVSFTPAMRRIFFPIGGTGSPSLRGSTSQLANAQFQGASTPSTVLDPGTTAFNQTFDSGGSNPSVPITRIDISGFGESTFSDWRNPSDAAATISNVLFNLVVGRTSREVVQIYSIKYPFATRVVKTITTERQNSGIVNRSESNWVPVSDGKYQYPHTGITTNIGTVLGISNVANIRDTGSIYKTQDGSQLEAVVFDCSVQVENVIKGAGADGLVPGRNLLGYVQISDRTALPPLGQHDPIQYTELIKNVGPMCGQIDCVINVGNSGVLMKVKRMGVASTVSDAGTIEFVMETGGAVGFPGAGLWSFVSYQPPDVSPKAVDPIDGVPLVRRNATTTTPVTVYPYVFQHGADLLPSSAASYICLMHSTGTQCVIFPQPKIEPTGPHQLTSTIPPLLADPHALATATGPFPRLNLCIPFPNPNYSLLVGSDGSLSLQQPQPSFQTNIGRRVLRSSKTLETRAYCQDENGIPSVVTLSIDSAAAIPWTFKITNVMIATASGSLGEVIKVVGDIAADTQTTTQLKNARIVFANSLKPLQAVVSFLEHFAKIPGPTVSMTADWEIDVSLKCDFIQYLKAQDPALGAVLDKFFVDLDFKYSWQFSAKGTSNDFVYEVTVKVPTGIGPVVAIALASFEIHLADGGPDVCTSTLGAGIGVAFTVFGFDALAYWAVTQSIIAGDEVFGVGAGTLIKGSIDLKVVEVDVEAEASMALTRIIETIWGVAQVTLAVDITIFWVLEIDFAWTHQWTNNFNGGPDQLLG